MADITSYDYDAIMDESGDVTEKFNLIRNVISQHFNLTNLPPIPVLAKKMTLPSISVNPIAKLLSPIGRKYLGRAINETQSKQIVSQLPLRFEQLNQYSGLVLYETDLPTNFDIDPSSIRINDLRDRALIYVDNVLVGILSRENALDTLPLRAGVGKKLQILVENQGRINFNNTNDQKVFLKYRKKNLIQF